MKKQGEDFCNKFSLSFWGYEFVRAGSQYCCAQALKGWVTKLLVQEIKNGKYTLGENFQ